ncbi:MAG TPA: RsfS/YbeB/iojap family protein, partial [Planctomycetota bacterium]|nr:RsfS/YbeB/iojap family protein [Planctomycetota bacterium]
GALAEILGIEAAEVEKLIGEQFKGKDKLIPPNIEALEMGRTHARAEGVELGWWILCDFGDVVVHILQPEAREFYSLDDLYGDCPKVDWAAEELPTLPPERV